ncbi:MAG: RNA 2',3'-cyclic phosphodiesterase [Candidatus Hadarchaeum sp.]|uniref:RNA 2',3'-cyclic phosphodiesterase n=1 Tax=Candidatus Hadarchaeum sp. TaxID=2883567 RepID=UPI003D0DB89F
MPRAFIAIDIDEQLRKKLVDIQSQLKDTGGDFKLVEPQNIHVTLKFLGEIPDKKVEEVSEGLKRAAKGSKKFNLEVRGIGAFPNLNYVRVIWAGIEKGKEEILLLQKKVEQELQKIGFRPEGDFVPHLTIARVKSARNKEKLASFIREKSAVGFGTSPVSAVELKKSVLTPKGPIYSTLTRVELED